MSAKMNWDNVKKTYGNRIGVSVSQIEQSKFNNYLRTKDYIPHNNIIPTRIQKHTLKSTKIKFPEKVKYFYEVNKKLIIETYETYSSSENVYVKDIYEISVYNLNNSSYKKGNIVFFSNVGYCIILSNLGNNYYKIKTYKKIEFASISNGICIIKSIDKKITLTEPKILINKMNIKIKDVYCRRRKVHIVCDVHYDKSEKTFIKHTYSINPRRIPNFSDKQTFKSGDIINFKLHNIMNCYGIVISKKLNTLTVFTVNGIRLFKVFKFDGINHFKTIKY